jgi:hypothetical protein
MAIKNLFKKERFYLFSATYDLCGDQINGVALFKKFGKCSIYDLMEYTARRLGVQVGRIMPIFVSEISKDEFKKLDKNFELISKENISEMIKRSSLANTNAPSDVN